MAIQLGDTIGRYQIMEVVGVGGMASVFRALDTILERDVAIKLIRRDAFSPAIVETVFRRFEREARVLARLSHPNIVKIHDIGSYAGDPFLVMEYIPGGTLKDRLGEPVRPAEIGHLLAPVARALDYAHNLNIVHRDVKPSNIMLTATGEPMLTDFGVAKILEANPISTLTGSGVGLGTPEYMAPEQGLGKDVDRRADVYALGIVMYELLTGHRPFQAHTPMETIFMHLTTPLPSPREYVPDLPMPVEQVLIRALAKQPEDRYPSMGEFARLLEELAAGQLGRATLPDASLMVLPSSPQEKIPDPAKPQEQPVTGGAAALPSGGSPELDAKNHPPTPGSVTPPTGWWQLGIPRGWEVWRRLTRSRPASAALAVMGIAIIALLAMGGLNVFGFPPSPTPTSTPTAPLVYLPMTSFTDTATITQRPSATATITANPSATVTPIPTSTLTPTTSPTSTKVTRLPTWTHTPEPTNPPATQRFFPYVSSTPVPPGMVTQVLTSTDTPKNKKK